MTECKSEDTYELSTMLEEVFSAFPQSTLVEDNGKQPVNITVVDSKDPLLEDLGNSTKFLQFVGEFHDDEFFNDQAELDDQPVLPAARKSGPGRPKKARLVAEIFKGRNGHVWNTVKPVLECTMPPVYYPRGKGPARNVSNALEAWDLLLDEPIVALLVRQTNEVVKSRERKANYERATDTVELRAWLGLCYLCGVFRHTPQLSGPLDELWTVELGNAVFRATMSLKRFQFLGECIRLGKPTGRDSASGVSQTWTKFLINCRSYYAPSVHCSIDEQSMEAADGTEESSETSKQILRLVTLCDAKSLYLCNAFFTNDSATKDSDLLRLVSDLKSTERNIILNQRYSSLKLCDKLHRVKLSCIGVLPVDAAELPTQPDATANHSQLYSGSATLIHSGTQWLLSSGLPSSLNALLLYTRTCDTAVRFRQSTDAYSTAAATPLQPLYTLLDYAALNAWVLLRLSDKGLEQIRQRDCQRQLGLHLTQQHLRRRLLRRDNNLTIALKLQIAELLGEPTLPLLTEASTKAHRAASRGSITQDKLHLPTDVRLVSKHSAKRARCRKCPKATQLKTRMRCQQCTTCVCLRHLIFRCSDCTGVNPEVE